MLLRDGARHRAAVELGARRLLGAERERDVDAAPVRPWVGTDEEPALVCETNRVAAGGDHEWPLPRLGCTEPHLAGRTDERFGETGRVEPPPGGQRVRRVRRALRPEPAKPLERVVEPLPHEPLQRLVPARALTPVVVEVAVAPDDAAGEQHRAARPIALLQHGHVGAELPQARGCDKPRHAGSDDGDQEFTPRRSLVDWVRWPSATRRLARPGDPCSSRRELN